MTNDAGYMKKFMNAADQLLEIDSDLIIDERMLITDEGDGGLDRWIQMDDQEIVIDT